MLLAGIPLLLSPMLGEPVGARATARAPAAVVRKPAPRQAKPARPRKPPVSAAAAAVAVQIRAKVGGPVKDFYGRRGYWPLWAPAGKIGPEAQSLVAMLDTADRDGLNPRDYHADDLRRTVAAAKSGDPVAVALADVALSRALAAYVGDQRRPPKVGMKYLDDEVKPHRPRPTDVLNEAALVTSLRSYVTAMGWMNPLYVRLRDTPRRALSEAAQQRLRLNMDRARLLPGPWTRHIVVDASAARLYYFDGGKQRGTMRVIVGTPQTPTPMLAGMVRYAILNPYWNVPTDLVRTRVVPKIRAGATLASLRYEALSDWSATPARLPASSIDWNAVASGKTELRLRQLPGPGNSMGRVKFMFPNDLGIYLHDTNEPALLQKLGRHFSNGCVRLEDAPRLGRWLMGKPITTITKRPEQAVGLTDPVPVYLTYFTVAPAAGGVTILADVYGRDGRIG
jgi:murein L,D-transpeptidase YcbB/YkuD